MFIRLNLARPAGAPGLIEAFKLEEGGAPLERPFPPSRLDEGIALVQLTWRRNTEWIGLGHSPRPINLKRAPNGALFKSIAAPSLIKSVGKKEPASND